MFIQPLPTLLTTAIWLQSALSRPTGDAPIEVRDHVECSPQGQCYVMKTCDNDFNVAAGSDPNTPGTQPPTPPATFAGTRPRDPLIAKPDAVIQPAASASGTAQTKSKRHILYPPTSLTKRQSSTSSSAKWCALGTNLYVSINEIPAGIRINKAQITALIGTAADNIQQYLSARGDGPVSPPPANTNGTTPNNTPGAVSASLVSSGEQSAGTQGLSPIFSVAPGGGGGDTLQAYDGTQGGMRWLELLLAVLALKDWCKQKQEGCGWLQVGVVVGTSQVGKISVT